MLYTDRSLKDILFPLPILKERWCTPARMYSRLALEIIPHLIIFSSAVCYTRCEWAYTIKVPLVTRRCCISKYVRDVNNQNLFWKFQMKVEQNMLSSHPAGGLR